MVFRVYKQNKTSCARIIYLDLVQKANGDVDLNVCNDDGMFLASLFTFSGDKAYRHSGIIENIGIALDSLGRPLIIDIE